MIFKEKQRLVMIGDSITDVGRARPIGQNAGLGNGYVMLADAMLKVRYPKLKLDIYNMGISGNRVTDLRDRWQSDVIELKPDWVSVMIGINDVWRHFDRPLGEQVDIDEYETVLDALIEKTLPHVEGMILMTPYYLESNKNDPMRSMMDEYSAAVKKIADKHNTIFVDIQSAFDEFLQHVPTQSLCGDRVHPNMTGHMLMAEKFLEVICA